MSSSDSSGMMSNAGLVRYFDAEDRNSVTIPPEAFVAFVMLFAAFIILLNGFA